MEVADDDPTAADAAPKPSGALSEIARALEARPFRPHPLFRGGHAQTLVGYAHARRAIMRESARDEARLFETAPGVRVMARCRWQSRPDGSPTLVLVHGLEGSSESRYMLGTADKAYRAGFNTLRTNIRTCGGTETLAETLYHSGLTEDLRAILAELRARDGLSEIYLAGFSLGGNQCLKLAGELGADAPRELRGVAAVSPSLDLSACAAAIERRANWLYNQRFVAALKRRMTRAAELYPERYDPAALRHVRTVRDFDTRYTAPHSGFRDADDYYARASALQFVGRISVPTLVVHAQDDPFVPYASFLHRSLRDNPRIVLLAPARGGHVGFVADARRGAEDRFWAENRVVEFCRMLHERATSGV
jgi:predicted alpha/beta-fold hydrolase